VIVILSGFSAPHCGAAVYHSHGSAASLRALYNRALNGDKITPRLGTFTPLGLLCLFINVSADGGNYGKAQ
jgi:hypothetical protein